MLQDGRRAEHVASQTFGGVDLSGGGVSRVIASVTMIHPVFS